MAPGGSDDFGHRSASATADGGRNGLGAPVELTFSLARFVFPRADNSCLKVTRRFRLEVVRLKFCLLWSSAPAKWSTRIRS